VKLDTESKQIRLMAAADLAQVTAIADALPKAPHWPRSTYLKVVDPSSEPRRIGLVAAGSQSGTIFGFAIASLVPPQAELEIVAIAPQSQRQGIGAQLLVALMAALRASGIHELLLEVRASNHAAISLYGRVGFTRSGLRTGYYAEPVEDAVLMRLPLD
jgi:ribosomal-protein-alanine N-acetyltransferase